MSSSRPLCRLCERPTADGAVQAAQVDKEKLQTWFLDVYEHKLAVDIKDADLICFFCIWHAEFVAKNDPELNALAWWPASLDYLDGTAKELRKEYLEGKAEKCWARVTSQQESPEPKSDAGPRKTAKKCFYCDSSIINMAQHVKQKHKDAIRCDYLNCSTYFHTQEEKAEHFVEEHEKPKEQKLMSCMICEKEFKYLQSCRKHILQSHPEYSVGCDFRGCLWYSKREEELRSHLEAVHKIKNEAMVLKCRFCEFKTIHKKHMKAHITRQHAEKTIKCDECDRMFATNKCLEDHMKTIHTFFVCIICGSDILVHNKSKHLTKYSCMRCQNKFECSGLYSGHKKSCVATLLKCDQCSESFKKLTLLRYHVKSKHSSNTWRGLKYEKFGAKCEPCKRYYPNAERLRIHCNYLHLRQRFVQCAHCPKNFNCVAYLKHHLANEHDLIEREFSCDECEKNFVSLQFLKKHKLSVHVKIKNRTACPVCEKSLVAYKLRRHLLNIHGVVKNN